MSINGQNLKKHQWKQRVILIIANDAHNESYQSQLEELNMTSEELKERKLIRYTILPYQYKLQDKTDRDWIKGSELYKAYNSEKVAFKIILIGLDGSVKIEQRNILTTKTLLSTIDAMPMRRTEIKHKG